jgi:type I restriction enzyme M protein
MPKELTLQDLKSYLWESANILRGSIDSGDFKNYILGMLFFKRLSDVYDEAYVELVKTVGAELANKPDMHPRFKRPADCSWKDILNTSVNIGEKINHVFSKVTLANAPRLDGILDRIDFADKSRLSDSALSSLVQHFNRHTLGNQDVTGDMLGQAYEYLIEQFADDAGKKGGEFYTPAMVTKLLVTMLKPHELESIYDPCCGSGGMLIQAAKYLVGHGGNPTKLFMYGQENNYNTYIIAKMNMFLHGYDDAHIEREDTFEHPKHVENGKLKKFDIVLANPPWNQSNWHYEKWKNGDPYNRFTFGLPPKGAGDWAWLQLMYASLKPKGRMGIVLDNGVLFRGNSEEAIRKQFLEKDLIEAVIGLTAGLFYNTGSPGCLMLFNDNKPVERKGKVLFIDASKDYLEGKAQNFLRQEDIERTARTFDTFGTVERYCTVAGMDEIKENDCNLNISRYVDTTEPEEPVDIPAAIANIKMLQAERAGVQEKLDGFLKELGY